MEILLQMAGVAVPTVTAVGGLFAWGLRRMDRRFEEARNERRRLEVRMEQGFEEARQERARIESQLGGRLDRMESHIDERFNRMESRFDQRFDRTESWFGERSNRTESRFDERFDRVEVRMDGLEKRIDRVAEHLSGQMLELNRELGKLQGITEAKQVFGVASS